MVGMQKIFKEYLASDEREVRFAFVKFNSCNGMKGRSFSKAECEFDVLKENENNPLWVTLEMMFKNGEDFIKTIRNGEETTDPLKTGALGRIKKYYQSKGKNEESLKKVFGMETATETDITVVLAEHLLMALSPGQSYSIDNHSKIQKECKCGCKKKATYGDTMIGNKSVWYGRIDVIISSAEIDVAVDMGHLSLNDVEDNQTSEEDPSVEDNQTSEEDPSVEDNQTSEEDPSAEEDSETNRDGSSAEDDSENDEEETPDEPPVGESIVEVKKSFAYHSMNQALAQTIVFSCLKKKSALQCNNHMVPNIVISKKKFKIIMYDAAEDVLLYSRSISLFDSDRKLSSIAIVVLWMVLHYRLFCSGFSGAKRDVIKRCKSGFPVLVGDKWMTYSNDLNYVEPGYKKYANIDKLLKEGRKLNLFQE